MSPIERMYSDLKLDFRRYEDYHGYGVNLSVWEKFRVLLKSRAFISIIIHRFGFWISTRFQSRRYSLAKTLLRFLYFLGKLVSVFLVKIDILVTADIGPGLFLSNKGNMMVGVRKMGGNCTIHHNVTIGQDRDMALPVLGDNVWVGPDSIVYGGITIGEDTVITGSTVLSKSIPPRMMVGGNPCKLIKKNIESTPRPSGFDPSEDV